MSSMDKLASELSKAIKEEDSRKPTAYDTPAEVLRVEGDTAWVHIPGGVDETPIKRTINANTGDVVQVRVSDGQAWITGNASNPPTDDTRANYAAEVAVGASEEARSAVQNANIAQVAAENAVRYADEAREAAEAVEELAQEAKTDAADAKTAATEAKADAVSANESAISAGKSANSALSQLSYVEDVVGTLNWISEHATYKLTKDTEIVDGKLYFAYDEEDQTYERVLGPDENPQEAGYYEIDSIDEAVTNFISTHLALTEEGLFVFKDENTYKVLLSTDALKIIDTAGITTAQYGSEIYFDANKEFTIGNEDVYIKYYDSDDDGIADSISINATNLILGQSSVEETLNSISENINQEKERVDTVVSSVDEITTSVEENFDAVTNELTNQSTLIAQNSEEIQKYSGFIEIKPEEPSIKLASNLTSYMKIVPSKLVLVNDNVEIAYLSDERLYAPSAVVNNLYMQMENAETGERVGGIGWVMRSNGHLSMRLMR